MVDKNFVNGTIFRDKIVKSISSRGSVGCSSIQTLTLGLKKKKTWLEGIGQGHVATNPLCRKYEYFLPVVLLLLLLLHLLVK